MTGSPVIPEQLSPLDTRYTQLTNEGQREPGLGEQQHHLQIAQSLQAEALVTAFLDSVKHHADYKNNQPFYPCDRPGLTEAKYRPATDTDLKTNSIAWWLACKDRHLRHADGSELGLRYLDRELVPLRTQGHGAEMSRRSRRSPRLDLLLCESDGRPVIGEIKAKSDQHPFYGCIQALMHVSQLASPAQRARLKASHNEAPIQQPDGRLPDSGRQHPLLLRT